MSIRVIVTVVGVTIMTFAAAHRAPAAAEDDWPRHGRTHAEQRYSPLDQVHTGNVAKLGLAWSYETGTRRGLEATPIVADGVLYATGTWSVVYALDAKPRAREIWRSRPESSA